MKYCIWIILCLAVAGCSKSNMFTIDGVIEGKVNGDVRLLQYSGDFRDSKLCKIEDGRFSFSGYLSQPEEFMLVYEESGPQSNFEAYSIFLKPSHKVQVLLRPDSTISSTISGPKLSALYDQATKEIYDLYLSPIEVLNKSYDIAIEDQDHELQEQLLNEMNLLLGGIQKWKSNYIETNPKSYISAFFLYTICQELPVEETQSLYERLNRKNQYSRYRIAVGNYLSVLPGNPYIDFVFVDAQDEQWTFSDLVSGKVVLIDFWASWCGPCREQNKILTQIYRKHNQRGFEIIGVSTDRDTSSFRQTITEDNISWENFIDRTDDKSVKRLYWANSIPSNVLIDKSGIIRYRNIEVQTLAEAIQRLLEE